MKTKKQQIKQQIAATIVVFFMMVMVFGSRSDLCSAIGNNTTLTQNIVTGAMSMEISTTNLVFSDLTVGIAANSVGNVTQVNMRDYRGSGAGWTVSAVLNNLTASNGVAGINNISNAAINWLPGAMYALDGGSNSGVQLGTGGTFATAQTLINSSANNGMGNYKVVNTMINILYSGTPTQKQAMYQNILLITMV